ncbi:hypothetical protein LOTGIDRAFT_231786 [Lottia gigantea]|uniref:Uncharacterized protein n=1 Tax=Lottia gigantea TaxID=225164 RepID=V4ANT5_LOTGI|nr:hypothetical protein LOTGIDRAFT_231786 [Lottia gigantea]ESO96425.1 hypothetical protein LOTGIDRAFT_231786 [Lottia gigantea]
MAGRGNPMPHMNGANRFLRNPDFRYHSIDPHQSKGMVSLYDSTYDKRDFRDSSPFGPHNVRDHSPFGQNMSRETSPYGLVNSREAPPFELVGSREPSPFRSNMRRDPSPFCGANMTRETSPYGPREAQDAGPYYNNISGHGRGRFQVRDNRDNPPFRPETNRDGHFFRQDQPPFRPHEQFSDGDGRDRRIAVVNTTQKPNEPSDKRIAVQSPQEECGRQAPPNENPGRQTRSSSYSSNEGKGNNSRDTPNNSSISKRLGPSSGKPASNSGDAGVKDLELKQKDKNRSEKEKRKELERIRRLHRKKKEESTKDRDSKSQKSESPKTKAEDSDTELEDERASPVNNRRHKERPHKRSRSRSSHGSHRRRSLSISSQKSSRKEESFEASPSKIPKQSLSKKSPNSENKRRDCESPRSEKFSPKSVSPTKRLAPKLADDNSPYNTVEEGELKSSESSQCDDTDIPRHKIDFDQKPVKSTETYEDLKLKNTELELEVKALKNELLNEKKAVERLFKDNDTKIENQQEYYHDDLEVLRKEVAYFKKENDRERDLTDMAKSKERDLLNKVRRLEDSLLHSGKENLDLKEKLKRLTEENDSFRYGNYSRYPPVAHPVQTFRYQQPHPPPW